MKTKRQLTMNEMEQELHLYLQNRKEKNRRYSIRAMALSFGVVPSSLQKVIRRERKLGQRLAQEIAAKLDVEIVRDERTPKSRNKHGYTLSLDSESSSQVSWLNLAILEMIKLKDFRPDSSWIALRLGLPTDTVETALIDMENQRMLKRDGNQWSDLLGDASSGAEEFRSTETIRRMQRDLLELSKVRLQTTPYEKREHGFSIVPISKRNLPQIKKKIQRFRWELCEYAQKQSQPKDAVYALQVGFFGLTQENI